LPQKIREKFQILTFLAVFPKNAPKIFFQKKSISTRKTPQTILYKKVFGSLGKKFKKLG
jgi:hypothetical protein